MQIIVCYKTKNVTFVVTLVCCPDVAGRRMLRLKLNVDFQSFDLSLWLYEFSALRNAVLSQWKVCNLGRGSVLLDLDGVESVQRQLEADFAAGNASMPNLVSVVDARAAGPMPPPETLSPGAIAGIVVGGLVLLAAIITIVIVVHKKHSSSSSPAYKAF
jgi:hypothetical protein